MVWESQNQATNCDIKNNSIPVQVAISVFGYRGDGKRVVPFLELFKGLAL